MSPTAALFGTNLSKEQFIATSTAVALIVDGARLPVYLVSEHDRLVAVWPLLLLTSFGAVGGTLLGHRVLRRLPPESYRVTVACLLAVLGIAMLVQGLRGGN